ncbi:protein late bloomer-like [Teleopsis dalmanni]|uniref:protein late bloomer-like n=1 Tax=Teleopsis dalmanni TaxID=139649 RepID=UPI0018CD182A|nr:protein late bloomer-like [Teleopsis dalmanni]
MNFSIATVKYLLVAFNSLCVIAGVIIAVFSIIAIDSLQSNNLTYCIFGITLGSIVFLISSMGFFGALREKHCCLWIYAVILGILIGIEISILVIFRVPDFVKISTEVVEKLWDKEIEQPGAMSQLEQQLKCCGLHSSEDYIEHGMPIPSSCYEGSDSLNPKALFTKGCSEALAAVATEIANILKTIYWIITGVEVIALLCATILANKVNSYERMREENL